MATRDKLARAKQLADQGKLSRGDYGALTQMSKSASARAGFGGADDGGGNEMPGPQDEEQDEGAEGETVSPAMVRAGVQCLNRNKGKKPAELVRAIFAAMENAEQD